MNRYEQHLAAGGKAPPRPNRVGMRMPFDQVLVGEIIDTGNDFCVYLKVSRTDVHVLDKCTRVRDMDRVFSAPYDFSIDIKCEVIG